MKKLINQIMKFGVVGALCFFIDYGTMILLVEVIKINYLLSAALSFIVSVIVNYYLSMRFVFTPRTEVSKTKEFIVFVILSAIGLLINELIMLALVDFFKVHYTISKIIATFIVMAYNFITRKFFLEKKSLHE